MQVAVYGRLGQDPRSIDTASGKAMTVASVAVDVQERNVDNPEPEWLGIVAFGGQAEKLLQHAKGECVSVSGRVQRNRYTDRDGNERVQLQVIADNLISARTVRPGNSRRQAAGGGPSHGAAAIGAVAAGRDQQQGSGGGTTTQGEPANAGGDFYDDDIPF